MPHMKELKNIASPHACQALGNLEVMYQVFFFPSTFLRFLCATATVAKRLVLFIHFGVLRYYEVQDCTQWGGELTLAICTNAETVLPCLDCLKISCIVTSALVCLITDYSCLTYAQLH